MALTREPSLSRASTIGDDSSMRRPIGETMRSMTCMSCSVLSKVTGLLEQLALLLDVDLVGSVDHDLGDVRIRKQVLERSEAENVMDERLDHPEAVLTAHRHALLGDDLTNQLGNALTDDIPRRRVGVAGKLLNEALVDPGPKLGVDRADGSPGLPRTGDARAAEQGVGTVSIARAPSLTGAVQQRGRTGALARTAGVTGATEQGGGPVAITRPGAVGRPHPQRRRRSLSGRGAPELRRLQRAPGGSDRGGRVDGRGAHRPRRRRGEQLGGRGAGGRQRKRRRGRRLCGHPTRRRSVLSLPLDAVEKRHPLSQPTCRRFLAGQACSA